MHCLQELRLWLSALMGQQHLHQSIHEGRDLLLINNNTNNIKKILTTSTPHPHFLKKNSSTIGKAVSALEYLSKKYSTIFVLELTIWEYDHVKLVGI